MKFTPYTGDHFKVSSSVVSSTCTMLGNYHPCLVPEYASCMKGIMDPFLPSTSPGNHESAFCLYGLPVLDISYNM